MSDNRIQIYHKLKEGEYFCKLWFDSSNIKENYTQNDAITLCRQYLSDQHKYFQISSLLSLNAKAFLNKRIGFLMQQVSHVLLYLVVKGYHDNTYKRIPITIIGKPVFYGFHFQNGGILFEIITLRSTSIFKETFWISLINNRILYVELDKK